MRRTITMLMLAVGMLVVATGSATTMQFTGWGTAVSTESVPGTSDGLNTGALEGCAFVAQRDDVLYFASNRAGGRGGLDIWYATKDVGGAWGYPANFEAVNTAADELCPTAHRNGKDFLFVRSGGACGGQDLFATRLHATRGWASPWNLGCTVNSAGNEASPYLLDDQLYFSSNRPGGMGGSDIYVSSFDGVSFGAPTAVPGVNTAVDDSRPNLRRDGLELFFDSNRPGGQGGIDLWSSTRDSRSAPWSVPVNLGHTVNSSANDLRATLSWDGATLYFGSTRAGGEGVQDLYVTTRAKVTGTG